jgi:hypothetical protein
MAVGIPPRDLAKADDYGVGSDGATATSVPFVLSVLTVAGTTEWKIYNNNCPRKMRVIKAWGYMTGAGGANDTVVVDDGTTAITDTADLSVFSDTDQFDFSQISDATNEIAKNGSLHVTTADDALCRVFVMCEWVD